VEMAIMRDDVRRAGEAGADGVVFGLLRPDGAIDLERTGELVELAGPMSTTFHRAFDMTADPLAALESLVELGLDRVLTSGQRPSAPEGADLLARLVERAGDRLVVMPAVGIDAANIAGLIRKTGASEYHVLAQRRVPSRMAFRNEAVFMGTEPDASEYETWRTDAAAIRAICEAAATCRKA
jgi:copper homeostasis protein